LPHKYSAGHFALKFFLKVNGWQRAEEENKIFALGLRGQPVFF
jgi:hypothetical protein